MDAQLAHEITKSFPSEGLDQNAKYKDPDCYPYVKNSLFNMHCCHIVIENMHRL